MQIQHFIQQKNPWHSSCFAFCLLLHTAEGQNRLFSIITAAAETREAGRAGVWASFGQPYVCLGLPQQVCIDQIAPLSVLSWVRPYSAVVGLA
jgi:drug/metabolite transporter superfamily protein YnfA